MDAEYPLTGLRGGKDKLGAWVAAGYIRKLALHDQLLRYCRFDTEAMVEIVRFLS